MRIGNVMPPQRANAWWLQRVCQPGLGLLLGLLLVTRSTLAEPPVLYRWQTLAGTVRAGLIKGWDSDQALTLEPHQPPARDDQSGESTGRAERIQDWHDLRYLERVAGPRPRKKTNAIGWQIELRPVGRVYGERLQLSDERLSWELIGGGRFEVPIDQVIRLRRDTPEASKVKWVTAAVDQDRVLFRAEDREQVADGLVSELRDGQLVFSFDGRETRIPEERLVALVLASPAVVAAADREATSGRDEQAVSEHVVTYQVTLRGGQRLQAHSWKWLVPQVPPATRNESAASPATGMQLKLAGGGEGLVSWDDVERIEVQGGRLVPLSDLKPESYEHRPLVTARRDYGRDVSLDGRSLQIAKQSYRRGISMPGPARLSYELRGAYETFAAAIGIDDETAGRGDAVFVLKLDDREVYRERCRGGEAAKPVRLSVAGARQLTLEILPGEHLELSDHANWADAHLIKPSSVQR